MKVRYVACCVTVLLLGGLAGAEPVAGTGSAVAGLVGQSRQQALAQTLVGVWRAKVGKRDVTLQLGEDGSFRLDGRTGTYRVGGRNLVLRSGSSEVTYSFDVPPAEALSPLVLTLSGGDLEQPLKMLAQSPVRSARSYAGELFEISPRSALSKLRRLAAIVLIVVMSTMLIWLLRALSQFVIYSDWGPLRYVYRARKKRALTVHSLVLNVLKYVVYFGALGQILGELGVNYATYLASLSVVGLAIGFGSQGLVQDIVTGFFIVFEGQFDVGDMVEISGQTGVVEEFGLRMTRLRNYLGQVVTIPNRNIALVGTYVDGAMKVRIDVPLVEAGTLERACELMDGLGGELGKQYEGVVLVAPQVAERGVLSTGESFVRIEAALWPQQQWVVEQQYVARLKDLLAGAGIRMAGDRICVSYHGAVAKPVRLSLQGLAAAAAGLTGQRSRRDRG